MIQTAQTPASACPEIPANEPKHTEKSPIKQRAGRAGWTIARRRAQSARLMAASARWPRPAGPRTAAGKNITRYNALKHGMRCAAHRALYHKIRHVLRAQRIFLKMVKLGMALREAQKDFHRGDAENAEFFIVIPSDLSAFSASPR